MSGHRAILLKTAILIILRIYILNLAVDAVQKNTINHASTDFQTQGFNPKIMDARSKTQSKFHTEGPQIFGDPVYDPPEGDQAPRICTPLLQIT
jgi:hypothetical protein